jgi:hypothetical protein
MANIVYKQESIGGGISSTYFGDTKRGQYRIGLGIDPDLSLTDKAKMSNIIYPTAYQKFSSTEITGTPISIINPRTGTARVYVIQNNGVVVYYDSALANPVTVGTVTGGVANGAFEQNNYIYIPTGTDVSRVGPLDGVVAITNNWWTSTISLTALTNTTYPSIRNVAIPNHWGCQAGDGAIYFLDFKDKQGLIHRLNTDSAGANSGSAYNVLDLPFGYYPTCIAPYGTGVVIGAIQTTDATLKQGQATLFFWDTISESFYAQVPLPDVFVTALYNSNGRLFVFTGSTSGCRVSLYAGGDTVTQAMYFDDGVSPLAGAVDGFGDRVVMGAVTSTPGIAAVVLSFGSKQNEVPAVFHCPIKTTAGSSNTPTTTAVKYAQQSSGETPRCVVGWRTSTTQGLDKYGLVYNGNIPRFRSDIFEVGKRFKVKRLSFNTSQATAAGLRELTVKIIVDNETTTFTFNGRDATEAFVFKRPEVEVKGNKNFCVDFEWLGSGGELAIQLPIEIEVEVYDDQPISL